MSAIRFVRQDVPGKRKVVAGVALLMAACLVWFGMVPSSKPKIVGDLSPADVAEIQRVARREIWRGTFPDWSWNSIKLFPTRVHRRASIEVKAIQVFDEPPPFGLSVLIRIGSSKPDAIGAASDFVLQKTQKGWKRRGGGIFYDPSP